MNRKIRIAKRAFKKWLEQTKRIDAAVGITPDGGLAVRIKTKKDAEFIPETFLGYKVDCKVVRFELQDW